MKTSKKALILHGTMGNPDGNWFPWLKNSLEQRGYEVFIPTFPTPENQNLKNWFAALKQQVRELNKIDIIIGHSLGSNFALHILENELCKAKNTILVSALNDFIKIDEYDVLNKEFFKDFDWKTIKQNSKKISILHGNNDPYVPIKQSQDIADALDIDLLTIKDGGHLNLDAGYIKFQLLLDLINE